MIKDAASRRQVLTLAALHYRQLLHCHPRPQTPIKVIWSARLPLFRTRWRL